MIKAIKSKAQERQEIEYQIRFYLQKGGKVDQIESGISGRPLGGSFRAASVSFNQPRESRTLLVDEVKAIDARKTKPCNKPHQVHKKSSQPRKVLITDDFGEPLKWTWQE